MIKSGTASLGFDHIFIIVPQPSNTTPLFILGLIIYTISVVPLVIFHIAPPNVLPLLKAHNFNISKTLGLCIVGLYNFNFLYISNKLIDWEYFTVIALSKQSSTFVK